MDKCNYMEDNDRVRLMRDRAGRQRSGAARSSEQARHTEYVNVFHRSIDRLIDSWRRSDAWLDRSGPWKEFFVQIRSYDSKKLVDTTGCLDDSINSGATWLCVAEMNAVDAGYNVAHEFTFLVTKVIRCRHFANLFTR